MELTKIVGTKVYSLFDCIEAGYVLGVIFNKKYSKITNLIVANDEDEAIYALNIKNIFKINKNCILIRNLTKLSVTADQSQNILKNTLLDVDGQSDTVNEIILSDNFEVLKLVGKELSIAPQNILYAKNHVIVCNTKNLNFRRKNFRPRTKRIDKLEPQTQTVVVLEEQIAKPKIIVANNLNNYVGKRIKENLYSNDNQVVAYKNSIITYNTVDLAKQLDIVEKLVELAK